MATVPHDKLELVLVQPAGSGDRPLVMLRPAAGRPSSVVNVTRTARLSPTVALIGSAGSTVATTALPAIKSPPQAAITKLTRPMHNTPAARFNHRLFMLFIQENMLVAKAAAV
jgi:hypothetical protein